MPVRPAIPADAPALARHRYPDEADAGERDAYAVWVAGALERGLYLGFLAVEEGRVVAGAGLTLLEWGQGAWRPAALAGPDRECLDRSRLPAPGPRP